MSDKRAAVFLDRDGVLIENRPDHVKSWREVRFLEGAFGAMRRLASSNYAVVIVTNQAAIGRGILKDEAAWELQRTIVDEIRRHGGRIDASYLCPHRPEDECRCRKPAPGMLIRAAGELALDLPASVMVGDAISDLETAWSCGSHAILVRTGRGAVEATRLTIENRQRSPAVEDLSAAVDLILASNVDRGPLFAGMTPAAPMSRETSST